mgnify:CR=1 FL=1
MPVSPFRRAADDGLTGPHLSTTGQLVPWIGAFLGAISEGRPVTEACRIAKINPLTAISHRKLCPEFRKAWKVASDLGTSLLEMEAYRRAYHGVEEPVFYQGTECGRIRRYSDGMMMFLLKSRRPETYRDMVEQGKGGVNVSIQANIAAVDLLRKQLAGEVINGQPLSVNEQITNNGQSLSFNGEIPYKESEELSVLDGRITDNSDSKCSIPPPSAGDKPIVVAGPSGPAPC